MHLNHYQNGNGVSVSPLVAPTTSSTLTRHTFETLNFEGVHESGGRNQVGKGVPIG